MALRVRDEQQLEQDGVAAAGEGDEAVHVDMEIPVAAGFEEEVCSGGDAGESREWRQCLDQQSHDRGTLC